MQTEGRRSTVPPQLYGVDPDAVALKVKQEFTAKEKARRDAKPEKKPAAKAKRAA